MTFPGFGTEKLVPLPEEFFVRFLPELTDPEVLQVVLQTFRLARRVPTFPRAVSWEDLLQDPPLRQALVRLAPGVPLETVLGQALAEAVRRGILLEAIHPGPPRPRHWYLIHTERNRQAVRWIEAGELDPAAGSEGPPPPPAAAEEPGWIFRLYEENIGLVPPLLAEELAQTEKEYPPEWIEEAFRIAVTYNKRSWGYIRAILRRWKEEGKD